MSAWLNGPGWHSAIFIIAALTLLIGVIATAATHYLRHDQDPELEADLDAQTLSSLPDLRTSDLVGTDRDPDPGTPAAVVAAGEDRRVEADEDGAQDLRLYTPGPDRLYGRTVDRLTGKQRRRAVKKDRIPRTLPGRVTNQADLLAEQLASSVGEPSLAGGVAPAPAAGQHHLPGPELLRDAEHRRAGEPLRPLTVYDPWFRQQRDIFPTLLQSTAWEADYRLWESELGPLVLEARALSARWGRELEMAVHA